MPARTLRKISPAQALAKERIVAHKPAVHEKGNAWLTFCQVVMYPMSFLLGRKKTSGRENVEIEGGYLLVANHISHLDPLYDSVAVRKSGRVPRFMAKASLWKVPVLGRALAGSEQIPVERGGAWYYAELTERSVNRERSEPTFRSVHVGLRICATPQ